MPILIKDSNPGNVSVHYQFWDALTKDSDSLALSQLWLCCLDRDKLRTIGGKLDSELRSIYEINNTWSTQQSQVVNVVLKDTNFFGTGTGRIGSDAYLLAQGVNFIPDGLNSSRMGLNQTGALKGLVIDSRLDLNAANVTFLETNVSFVDGFIRPWAALVGHRSLKDSDLRLNMEFICLEKWDLREPLRIRKTMVFRNAVPINIDAEEYNYSGDKLILRQVQFAFDRYELHVFPETNNTRITENDILGITKLNKHHRDVMNSKSPEKFITKAKAPVGDKTMDENDPKSFIDIQRPRRSDTLSESDPQPFIDEKINFRSNRERFQTNIIVFRSTRREPDFPRPKSVALKDQGEDVLAMEDEDFDLVDPSTSTEKQQTAFNKNILKTTNEQYEISASIKPNSITPENITNVDIEPIDPSSGGTITNNNIIVNNPSQSRETGSADLKDAASEKYPINADVKTNEFETHDIIKDIKSTDYKTYDINADVSATQFQNHDIETDIKTTPDQRHDITADIKPEQNEKHDMPMDIKTISNQEHEITASIKTASNQEYKIQADITPNTNQSHEINADIKNTPFDNHDIKVDIKQHEPQRHEISTDVKIISPANYEVNAELKNIPTVNYIINVDLKESKPSTINKADIIADVKKDEPSIPRPIQ